MYFRKLFFCNFRNFREVDLELEKGFYLLWGDNAQGKTNFIEAVFFLANLKSFRNSRNIDMIRWGEESCRVSGDVACPPFVKKIEVAIDKTGKFVRLNGKPVKSGKDYFGAVKTILFSPEELNLIKGGPAGRRALVDRAVFLSEPDFLEGIKKYESYLKNRNQLLRNKKPQDELDVWTEGFLKLGLTLRRKRIDYLREITPKLIKNYEVVTGKPEKVDILYPGLTETEEERERSFREELKKTREKERYFGYTLVGPHGDDPVFLLDGRPLKAFGSQGQKRSFLMAFKISQIQVIEEKTGKTPVLLLDDMASELDFSRQFNFFRFLSGWKGQVFVTTTDKHQLYRCGVKPVRSYQVSAGILEEV